MIPRRPRTGPPRAWLIERRNRYGGVAFALEQDQPVRALFLVQVEPLAVVAAHAFALDDLRSPDRAPLARLLADPAALALGPALDPKHRRHLRDDPERGADR